MTTEEKLKEFFGDIQRIADESDRRFDYANFKVAKFMIVRLKCARNSLLLMQSSNQLPTEKLKAVTEKLEELLCCWEEKKNSVAKTEHVDFQRYSCKTVPSGRPGRPPFQIDIDHIVSLREYHFSWDQISRILSIDDFGVKGPLLI